MPPTKRTCQSIQRLRTFFSCSSPLDSGRNYWDLPTLTRAGGEMFL
jgi:hypothetical protein